MTDFRADLHTHSTCSDGSCSPEELLHLAKQAGLSGISITDHDTVAAYTPELFALATQLELKLLVGVEFSSSYQGETVHILAYHFDPSDKGIAALCQRHQSRRERRNRAMVQRLRQKGMDISESELPDQASVGRPHIAQLLVQKGYVESVKEAFDRWIGDGKPGFAQAETISVQETLEIIHKAKGKAFIAHPHLGKRRLFRMLLQLPFDGVECYYARLHPHQEKPFIDMAQRKGLLMSGGSDFHGFDKPQNPLGCSWIDQKTYEQIIG